MIVVNALGHVGLALLAVEVSGGSAAALLPLPLLPPRRCCDRAARAAGWGAQQDCGARGARAAPRQPHAAHLGGSRGIGWQLVCSVVPPPRADPLGGGKGTVYVRLRRLTG